MLRDVQDDIDEIEESTVQLKNVTFWIMLVHVNHP